MDARSCAGVSRCFNPTAISAPALVGSLEPKLAHHGAGIVIDLPGPQFRGDPTAWVRGAPGPRLLDCL
jgi:hypothetical protein